MSDQEVRKARVQLIQDEGYHFYVQADMPADYRFAMDEPQPLGQGRAPNAARYLAAAVGHCLSASLLFCLQKSRVEVFGIETEAVATIARNQRGRWRIKKIDVKITVSGLEEEKYSAFERCMQIFEDYCIVTGSVHRGIPVHVEVHAGDRVFHPTPPVD